MPSFDVVSDLHIDQWDLSLENKYPCGEIKHFPFIWDDKPKSDILIIAGDVSDDLDLTITYLNEVSHFYKKILFVDGNHEHVNKYPKLYSKTYISEKIKNEKIVYLPMDDYIEDKTVFVGCCGWWDYDSMLDIEKFRKYFDGWIPLNLSQSYEFAENVLTAANSEFLSLKQKIDLYTENEKIEKIVIVTHTLPHKKFAQKSSTTYNTEFSKLFRSPKIKLWIFGHIHSQNDETIKGIRVLSNPRGRPEDYDRIEYSIKTETC